MKSSTRAGGFCLYSRGFNRRGFWVSTAGVFVDGRSHFWVSTAGFLVDGRSDLREMCDLILVDGGDRVFCRWGDRAIIQKT
ncbi:hypothetical protein QT970_28605 [Microcoleus sp. herbarium8]|uniref:hypothetical protein n=1 Tax=Microcoleus sp. herbarium8 TaxID=3055436 RepID=UPI002FD56F10